MSVSYRAALEYQAMSIEHILEAAQEPECVDDLKVLAVQLRAATSAGIPVVYAVLRAEAPVVKIGFSRHLADRTGRIRRMPGSRLVSVTTGGRAEERAIHERLASSRTCVELRGQGATEHFHLTDEVVAWINETREAVNLAPTTLDAMLRFSQRVA